MLFVIVGVFSIAFGETQRAAMKKFLVLFLIIIIDMLMHYSLNLTIVFFNGKDSIKKGCVTRSIMSWQFILSNSININKFLTCADILEEPISQNKTIEPKHYFSNLNFF